MCNLQGVNLDWVIFFMALVMVWPIAGVLIDIALFGVDRNKGAE